MALSATELKMLKLWMWLYRDMPSEEVEALDEASQRYHLDTFISYIYEHALEDIYINSFIKKHNDGGFIKTPTGSSIIGLPGYTDHSYDLFIKGLFLATLLHWRYGFRTILDIFNDLIAENKRVTNSNNFPADIYGFSKDEMKEIMGWLLNKANDNCAEFESTYNNLIKPNIDKFKLD